MGISCHLFICTFHLTLWVACVPLESPSAYNMYLSNLRIVNHINNRPIFTHGGIYNFTLDVVLKEKWINSILGQHNISMQIVYL